MSTDAVNQKEELTTWPQQASRLRHRSGTVAPDARAVLADDERSARAPAADVERLPATRPSCRCRLVEPRAAPARPTRTRRMGSSLSFSREPLSGGPTGRKAIRRSTTPPGDRQARAGRRRVGDQIPGLHGDPVNLPLMAGKTVPSGMPRRFSLTTMPHGELPP